MATRGHRGQGGCGQAAVVPEPPLAGCCGVDAFTKVVFSHTLESIVIVVPRAEPECFEFDASVVDPAVGLRQELAGGGPQQEVLPLGHPSAAASPREVEPCLAEPPVLDRVLGALLAPGMRAGAARRERPPLGPSRRAQAGAV